MAKPVVAGGELHESAEVHDAVDFAFENFADFNFTGQVVNPLDGFFGTFSIVGSHHDQARILDINLHAGLGNNFIDDFAAAADDVANFFRIDLQSGDARSQR